MKRTKKIALSLALVMLLCLLAACGGGSAARNDVAVKDISDAIAAALGNENFVEPPESYITGSMKIDPSAFVEYRIQMNSKGVNIDEFGVFKGKDADDTAKIQQTVKDYLAYRDESWMPEYMPEERPKLDSAQVKTMGNYVIYVILSDDNSKLAIGEFEKALKSE